MSKHTRDDILGAIHGAVGEHKPEVRQFLNDLDDVIRNEEHETFKGRMRELGEFLDRYGVPELWTVLFVRYGCNVSSEGWTLNGGSGGSGEWYRPGDEWRFVYGEHWRARREVRP